VHPTGCTLPISRMQFVCPPKSLQAGRSGINYAWPLPCAPLQGGLLGGLLGGNLNLNLPLGLGVDVDLLGGESVEIEINTPVGTIAVNIPDPVDAEAPSPGRKLLGVSLLTHPQ
jgi:hypothetical protein